MPASMAMSTTDCLRQVIANTLQIDAAGLQATIGHLVVATSAEHPAAPADARSVHDAAAGITVLLADRIPAGQEAQALAAEIELNHGRQAVHAVLGELADELLGSDSNRKLAESADESMQDVIDDVLERGEKYGFQPDEDMVREAVEESANLLNIELTEEQIREACERVMRPRERQEAVEDRNANRMSPAWSDEHREAANREGWDIWDTSGSECGPWQIQRFDEAHENPGAQLDSDDDALRIVVSGSAPHHEAARQFIKAHSTQEWEVLERIIQKMGKVQDDAKEAVKRQLKEAMRCATESGLFDDMANDVHPDTINHFCDAVDDLEIRKEQGNVESAKVKPVLQEADSNPFVTSRTVHFAEVSYWWEDGKVHDDDYKIKVNAALNKAAEAAAKKHDVMRDIGYCCQWEGLQFVGETLTQVVAAANDVSKALARFKGVKPLPFNVPEMGASRDDSPSPSM
ncbi:hypothetical protein [Paracidovorax wautersii]|uniref:Uncharacterized protein n=1 Tax=Paracidovorax wautersii TaxID=1177982 RepID=A0A1I2HR88_9BURK|nr:hypothetical protein [Paracidovorax wautersii]SFF32399.1 hypothetical protein SAMN04489711_13011 [Paracidovorax wautersii]